MSKCKKRLFDFTRFKQRRIVLKIVYFGWDYDGLASQQGNENTIEFHLFNALLKTCLIESRDKCNYNRCGRTDKGVSSNGQVLSLNVRSNLIESSDQLSIGLFTPEGYRGRVEPRGAKREEFNYVDMLNRVLPDHIKVIAWSPVSKESFSARFSCKSRSYSYIFPRGDLCIESMAMGLTYLIGEHDFRNLCSFDLKHGVTNHYRSIIAASVKPLNIQKFHSDCSSNDEYSFFEVIIVGQAFLYHQIRCIMTVLFLIGSRKEPPSIIADLLDIERCPSRPNYNRASPMPLCLFDCKYDPDDLPLSWLYDPQALRNLIKQLKNLWLQYKTKTLMIERVLFDLDHSITQEKSISSRKSSHWRDFGLECDNMSDKKYISLLKRPRDDTLDKKLEALKKKKALTSNDSE